MRKAVERSQRLAAAKNHPPQLGSLELHIIAHVIALPKKGGILREPVEAAVKLVAVYEIQHIMLDLICTAASREEKGDESDRSHFS